MGELKDHALWIIPEGETYRELKRLIESLSRKYSTPPFEPHITVLGRVLGSDSELFSKSSQVGSLIRPFHVALKTVDYLDEYFRCLFIRAGKSREIIDLHTTAKRMFTIQDTKSYMPHVSLIYGSLPADVKKKIISDIGNDFPDAVEVRSIHLISASVDTDPRDWYSVREFPLG